MRGHSAVIQVLPPAESHRPRADSRFPWRASIATLFLTGAFIGLGSWQIERRAWKLDLIARVETRLAAAPGSVPDRSAWPSLSRAADEYRRVRVSGHLLLDRSTRVLAVTERGPGFWILTPLVTDNGDTILVNRGFVPAGWREAADPVPKQVAVSGLLRMTEPGGGFLRSNDPTTDRWYSRDVAAISAARGLGTTAPFFVDADGSGNGPGQPVGGLTVVTFRNNHLIYAFTWFGLALLAAVTAVRVMRSSP